MLKHCLVKKHGISNLFYNLDFTLCEFLNAKKFEEFSFESFFISAGVFNPFKSII